MATTVPFGRIVHFFGLDAQSKCDGVAQLKAERAQLLQIPPPFSPLHVGSAPSLSLPHRASPISKLMSSHLFPTESSIESTSCADVLQAEASATEAAAYAARAGAKAARRIERLAVDLGHQFHEARQACRVLMRDSQRELAQVEACQRQWHARRGLRTHVSERVESANMVTTEDASRTMDAITKWMLARPDTLGHRDKYQRLRQVSFAKEYFKTRHRLDDDDEYRQEVVDAADSQGYEDLAVRVSCLAARLDAATATAKHVSEAVAHIDTEINSLKPYALNPDPAIRMKWFKAVGIFFRRTRRGHESQALDEAAEREREDAYIAWRAIRRLLEESLSLLVGHELTQPTSFSPTPGWPECASVEDASTESVADPSDRAIGMDVTSGSQRVPLT